MWWIQFNASIWILGSSLAFEADGIFCFLLDQILNSSFGFKIRISQHFQSKWPNVNGKSATFFFFLVKKRLLSSIRDVWKSAKFLKILPISLFYVLLKCLVEKMILIVLKSFRELKFLVAILERFGNYLSIKTFKCQSSLFQDCFWKSTRLSILLFFFLILMKMFFVWNVGTSSDVFKTKVLSLCKRKDGTLRTGLSPVVCTLKWQKMFTFRTGVV